VDAEYLPEVSKYSWQILVTKSATYARTHLPGSRGHQPTLMLHHLIGQLTGMKDRPRTTGGNGLNCTVAALKSPKTKRAKAAVLKQPVADRAATPTDPSYTPYFGVTWNAETQLWEARLVVTGVTKALGAWHDDYTAAIAYDIGALCYFGWDVYLNNPDGVPIEIYRAFLQKWE
jgi:hypothetical protein